MPTKCSMCNEAVATHSWGLPVCEACHNWLKSIDSELLKIEASDPEVKRLGDQIEEAMTEAVRKAHNEWTSRQCYVGWHSRCKEPGICSCKCKHAPDVVDEWTPPAKKVKERPKEPSAVKLAAVQQRSQRKTPEEDRRRRKVATKAPRARKVARVRPRTVLEQVRERRRHQTQVRQVEEGVFRATCSCGEWETEVVYTRTTDAMTNYANWKLACNRADEHWRSFAAK